jgi:hypothetical protein
MLEEKYDTGTVNYTNIINHMHFSKLHLRQAFSAIIENIMQY